MIARIVSGSSTAYKVLVDDKIELTTKCRKALNFKGSHLVIGDKVIIDDNSQIFDVLPRSNLLKRPKIANIDYGIITVSTCDPEFSWYLLDKFLTMLSYCQIEPIILFTKIDMLTPEEKIKIENISQYYEKNNFICFLSSSVTGLGFNHLKKKCYGKTIAFMGQTGSGKSSAINAMDPGFSRKIGEYSVALGRGKHQTKEVILIPFNGGFIGDTPGFSSLELELYKKDLRNFFPVIKSYDGKCYYDDCYHLSEPECIIKRLVEDEVIARESYQNYQQLIDELKKGEF